MALRLADRYTVIAPDLIGHGDSATPRGDYSLGAHAASIRDLMAVLGVERASIVGPLARRRCRDAVLLPVPAAHRAPCAHLSGADSAARSARCCARRPCPGSHAYWRTIAHPRLMAGLRYAGDGMRRGRPPPGRLPAGDRRRPAPSRRARREDRLPAYLARGDRPPRPARQRDRSLVPVGGDADS